MDQNGFMNLCAHLDASVPAVKEELSDTEADTLSIKVEKEEDNVEVDPELLDEDAHTFKIVTVNEDEAEQTWSDHEIRTLLHVCLHERICKQLEIPFRKKELFKEISQKMMEFGFFRTWTQCQTKYQNLKYEYSLLKNDVNLHSAPENSMKFYEEIDCIMQKQPSELAEDTRMSTKETCLVQSPEYYSRLHEKSAGEMNMDFNEDETHGLRKKRKASHYDLKRPEFSRVHTPDKTPASIAKGRPLGKFNNQHRNIEGESAQDVQLEGNSYSSQMFQFQARFKRNPMLSAKHCRSSAGKFRKVSKDIICLPAEYPVENCTYRVPRGKEREELAMQGLVGKILIQSSWSFENFRAEVSSLFGKFFTCTNQEFSFSFLQCLPGNRKLIKPNVSAGFKWSGIAIISLAAQGSLYIKTQHSLSTPAKGIFLKYKQCITDADNDVEVVSVITSQGGQDNPRDRVSDVMLGTEYSQDVVPQTPQSCTPLEARTKLHKQLIQPYSNGRGSVTELVLGKLLREDKTTEVYELPEQPGCVLIQSKMHVDYTTWKEHWRGKATVSKKTASFVFSLLQEAGLKTAFVKKYSDTGFIANHCEVIPIEWVCRRMTSGSFLGRNVDNIKGHRFSPPQVEMFKVDDCNKLSKEHFIGLKLRCAGLVIGKLEIDIMIRSTVAIFEILEKNWLAQDCTLVDIKIKFGVDVTKKEIILVDIIDCDSPGLLLLENKNQLKGSLQSRVVVLMESTSDLTHCEEIKKSCTNFGMSCELRVTSAHTGPEETLDILSEYEGDCIPTVFIAVAGESNGLGAILAGNTAYPVVNCPPLNAHWGAKDIWSSLRVPSGLGCSTVLSPEAAAQFAARIFGINDHMMWSKLRSCALNSWIALKQADANLREFRL